MRALLFLCVLLSSPAWAGLLWHSNNQLNDAGQTLQQLLLPDSSVNAMSTAERDAWFTQQWRTVLKNRERFAQYTLPEHWRTQGFERAMAQHTLAGYMRGQVPDYHGYRALHQHYQQLGQRPDYTPLPPGPEVRMNERDPAIVALRTRLTELGQPAPAPLGRTDVLDTALAGRLKQLQQAGGLETSGSLDAATRALLNRSPAELRAEIKINLQRWLLLPPATEDYVLINIPSYRLTLVRGGRPTLAMPVIVGRPNWPTPELATYLGALKVNPDWTPTASIMREDLLPAQQQDGGFLDRNGFNVWLPGQRTPVPPSAINWQQPPPGLRLVQQPGPANALGQLKFEMQNRHSVYLHDTPDKTLFRRDQRALSHGCVRLSQPQALATGLGWQLPAHSRTQHLPPPQRLPVYMVYFTTWMDGRSLMFAHDIYRKNRT